MINFYFYDLAKRAVLAAESVGIYNLDSRWLYSQFCHESNNFTSDLANDNHNLGGVTQAEYNDTPQPDGNCYYINFNSYEAYADYFGHYLVGFVDGGVDKATTLEDYIIALKNSPSGEYFGDSLENYTTNCRRIYDETF